MCCERCSTTEPQRPQRLHREGKFVVSCSPENPFTRREIMSSLKRSSVSLFAVLFVLSCAVVVSAQVITPRPSQAASVMQRIGATDVTITYSRPGVKGRQI